MHVTLEPISTLLETLTSCSALLFQMSQKDNKVPKSVKMARVFFLFILRRCTVAL